MNAMALRVLSRSVRLTEGGIEMMRATRRGQSVALNAADLEAVAEQAEELAVLPGTLGLVDAHAVASKLSVARRRVRDC